MWKHLSSALHMSELKPPHCANKTRIKMWAQKDKPLINRHALNEAAEPAAEVTHGKERP